MKNVLVYAAALTASIGITAFSQAQWRSDRKVFDALKENYSRLEAQTRFLSSGDRISDQALLLEGASGPTSLAEQVNGKNRVVYIEQRGCPFCDWFAGEMDRRNANWKDAMMVVSIGSSSDSLRGALRVASASVADVPGTPIVVVVDSTGLVRQAGLGAKRVLNILQLLGTDAPSFEDMLRSAKEGKKE